MSFEPLHNAHAIEQAAINVQTSDPLGAPQLAAVQQASERLAVDLPAFQPFQSILFSFGSSQPGFPLGDQPNAVAAPQGMAGGARSRIQPDGTPGEVLRFDNANLNFKTAIYSRWNDVRGAALKYLGTLLPLYGSVPSTAAVSLNFVDKFIWNGNVSDCRARELLRETASLLAPHVLDADDLWHSYTGRFLRADGFTKRLLGVNLDCVDQDIGGQTKRVVVITTTVTDIFGQPGFQPLPQQEWTAFLSDHMDALHGASKAALKDVLSEQMARRISLI